MSQQAPTGGNRQGWCWVVITEPDTRAALGEIYRKGAGSYLQDAASAAKDTGDQQTLRVYDSAKYLADRMQDAPVLVIPCITVDHLPENPPRRVWPGLMGSIMPAVWSFQLALRSRGLGSALTTLHLNCEEEAAALLGIPDSIMQVGLLPVAYTKGTDFKVAKRPPLEEIVHWERW